MLFRSLTRDSKTVKISGFSEGFGHNDLEPIVCRHYPIVAVHLSWLRKFGDARMSGSGACVFAEFPTESQARSVLAKLPKEMHGLVVAGLSRHPLAEV